MGSERTSPERRGPARRPKEESWYWPPHRGGHPLLCWSNGSPSTATGIPEGFRFGPPWKGCRG